MNRHVILPAMLLALAGCSRGEQQQGEPLQQSTGSPVVTASASDASVATEAARAMDWELTCGKPVRFGMTAQQVLAEFGKDARRETLTGAEGIEYTAIVLWGADPARRLELPYDAETPNREINSVMLGDKAKWTVRGIGLGDPLAKVEAANGKPFSLWGFDWDYGGGVSDWKGGKLDAVNRCAVSAQFAPGADALEAYAAGDSEFASNDKRVARARARVDGLGVSYGGRE